MTKDVIIGLHLFYFDSVMLHFDFLIDRKVEIEGLEAIFSKKQQSYFTQPF